MSKMKLELTWAGKDERRNVEPRILNLDEEKSYSKQVETKEGDTKPTFDNILIHGDNLLALKSLEADYAGQIKCIYIDPPYNTGKAFAKYDDGLEHSIWLSLMRERLDILHTLLMKEGSIWISIDDNELAYLKLLCDDIFGRNNFMAQLPTIMNLKGNQDEFGFAGTHEYTLVYAKDKTQLQFNQFAVDEEKVSDEWQEDEIGLFKKGATLKATGEDAPREKRPKMFYPILVNKTTKEVKTIDDEEYEKIFNENKFNDDHVERLRIKYEGSGWWYILPKDDKNNFTRWRWGWNNETKNKFSSEVIIIEKKDTVTLYKKQRPEVGEIPTRKPKSLFYRPEYSSGNGTNQIKKLFGEKAFDYPKPEELISDFITLGSNPGDLVLDSFLGSGTTAAVAQKMGRRWIGIEMGDQAYDLCIPRLQKVINGEDAGGITKSTGWQGGGGFKFYELGSSLIENDFRGSPIISDKYNPEMLAEAMCKIMGYKYAPDFKTFWKQGIGTEKSYLFTTTVVMTDDYISEISATLGDNKLLICCEAFIGNSNAHGNIKIKKIPSAILEKCEWGVASYPLPVREDFTEEDFEFEEE